MPEKFTNDWKENINLSNMQKWFSHFDFGIFKERPLLVASYANKKNIFVDYLYNGGMPEMTQPDLT